MLHAELFHLSLRENMIYTTARFWIQESLIFDFRELWCRPWHAVQRSA